MSRRGKFIAGGLVIAAALGYLIFTGVSRSVVYFVTPSELMAEVRPAGKSYRLGGMVVQGSLTQNVAAHEQRFMLTDGKASVPVYHRGIPPDLFGEGRGAVVEGRLTADGTFHASTIMAKHSEEYRAPDGAVPGHEELLRTLRPDAGGAGSSPAPR